MDRPAVDLNQPADKDFYALVGRVGLMLVEHNADAISVANFLREIMDAGGSALDLEQVRAIARTHLKQVFD